MASSWITSLIGVGEAGLVGDIPAELFEEGVDELAAKLSLVVVGGAVSVDIAVEGFDKLDNRRWDGCHIVLSPFRFAAFKGASKPLRDNTRDSGICQENENWAGYGSIKEV